MKVLIAASVLALSAGVASAEIVCNNEGDCWRTKEVKKYEPSLQLQIHPDNWKGYETESAKFKLREPGRGHGYYRNGTWVEIDAPK